MDLRFYKLRSCDADLLLIDDLEGGGRDRDWSAAARIMLDRRRGVGADRLAVLARSESRLWLRTFGRDGEASSSPYDAALCAARFLLDSGRSDSDLTRLRVPGGEVEVDNLDGTNLGIQLGQPLGLPDGKVLDPEGAAARRAVVEAGGERFEVLPLGIQVPGGRGPAGVAVFYEGGSKTARARISTAVRGKEAPPAIPVRLVSREELWVDGPLGKGLDSASRAVLALAAATAAGHAERGALVRVRGGGLWVEWIEDRGLYIAARPEYVFRGEFHLDD